MKKRFHGEILPKTGVKFWSTVNLHGSKTISPICQRGRPFWSTENLHRSKTFTNATDETVGFGVL